MKVNEDVWNFMQKHLGYNDEQMKLFRQNPRNEDVISKAPALMDKTIVIEVMEAHGCNSRHKAGDKFYFDGAGNLLTKLSPGRICFGALNAMPQLIAMAHELFYAGVNPNEMRFKRAGCVDVGIQCGGWGRIIMEIKVENRNRNNIAKN